MIIGVLKEPVPETRVSLLAEAVAALIKKGLEVWVEPGAGINAFCTDEAYVQAGASLKSSTEILSAANIVLSIHAPVQPPASGAVLIGMYQALLNKEKMEAWTAAGVTVFSMDMLPRTTRAQTMDVLSSQANIAGYKAVLLAANTYGRYFPMFMTAAGSIPPAKVLILGAGVAGLQAIATARRLGAVVEVFDTRPAVKEEVMSLGAKFVEVEGAADAARQAGMPWSKPKNLNRNNRHDSRKCGEGRYRHYHRPDPRKKSPDTDYFRHAGFHEHRFCDH